MKRYFSFAILLALMLSIFSLGYALTVQIGDGTATTDYLPIYGLYDFSYTQQIYTPTQINASGDITKIRFWYSSGSIANSKDWTIYMGHTDKTEFTSNTDWVTPNTLTQVFYGDVTDMLPATGNWMEITLAVPFNYNNSDNLVIAVHDRTDGWGSMSWGSFTSEANTGIYYRRDDVNFNLDNPQAAYSRTGSINRIQLVFPDTAPPLAPTLISPANGVYALDGDELYWSAPPGEADAHRLMMFILAQLWPRPW